jgi:hypothetical protein
MKRVDVLHPGPFVAAQASALWFPLTHCLAAAMSGALTILPALLAMLSTAGISLRLLLVSFCWPRADRRGAGRAVRWGIEDVRLVLDASIASVSASPLSASCSVS